jgi:hypothetical protein
VEAECAKVKGCVAFTYEVRRRRRAAAAVAAAGATTAEGQQGSKAGCQDSAPAIGMLRRPRVCACPLPQALFPALEPPRACGRRQARPARLPPAPPSLPQAAARADGGPQCGYLKGEVKGVSGRQGWDLYIREQPGGGAKFTHKKDSDIQVGSVAAAPPWAPNREAMPEHPTSAALST